MADGLSSEPILTADDIIRLGGACVEGVHKLAARKHHKVAAVMTLSDILKIVPPKDQHYVLRAACIDGTGDGTGYGNGNGYGAGDSAGYRAGNGDGYGYGAGYGNGTGYGYGYGACNGAGAGDGGFR